MRTILIAFICASPAFGDPLFHLVNKEGVAKEVEVTAKQMTEIAVESTRILSYYNDRFDEEGNPLTATEQQKLEVDILSKVLDGKQLRRLQEIQFQECLKLGYLEAAMFYGKIVLDENQEAEFVDKVKTVLDRVKEIEMLSRYETTKKLFEKHYGEETTKDLMGEPFLFKRIKRVGFGPQNSLKRSLDKMEKESYLKPNGKKPSNTRREGKNRRSD